jgi:hypothetical protein
LGEGGAAENCNQRQREEGFSVHRESLPQSNLGASP